jgi:hypothetical protein
MTEKFGGEAPEKPGHGFIENAASLDALDDGPTATCIEQSVPPRRTAE